MPRKPLLRQADHPYLVRIPGVSCRCQRAEPCWQVGRWQTSVLSQKRCGRDWLLLIQTPDQNLDTIIHQLRTAGRQRCSFRRRSAKAGRYQWTILENAEALNWAKLYLFGRLSPSLKVMVAHAFARTRLSGRALLRLRKEWRQTQAHRHQAIIDGGST